ncbi:SIR2-like domain-containing protein [Nannocystis exedens]|uniref:SIR2-like domain-containing protein n=1 Tax=Nannocystis exedens TaxID=54 RepID=A0A1I2GRY6_9BACT|nr:SIR2-like domain-containing protein [Nannocystis exedens]
MPFVGAGVSRAVTNRAGQPVFPTWRELLERAAQQLHADQKAEEARAVRARLERGEYLAAAQLARDGLRGRRWRDFLLHQFDPDIAEIDRSTLAWAESIWSLGSDVVVTTNYDRVLEWASPHPPACEHWPTKVPADYLAALAGRTAKPAVWHLHGMIQQIDSIILTSEDYDRLYSSSLQRRFSAALATLRSFLAHKSFVFFGFGFMDQRLLNELLGVVEDGRGGTGPHYAFVHRDESERLLPRVRALNLELVTFDEFGPPLVQLVRELGDARTARLFPKLTRSLDKQAPSLSPGAGEFGSPRGGGSEFVTERG